MSRPLRTHIATYHHVNRHEGRRFLFWALVSLMWTASPSSAVLREEERMEGYHRRGYMWPLPHFHPNTPGWNRQMKRRIAQVERIPDLAERYNGLLLTLTQAIVAPNLTETGWGLTRIPEVLTQQIQADFNAAMDEHRRLERQAVKQSNLRTPATKPKMKKKEDVGPLEDMEFQTKPYTLHSQKLSRQLLNDLKPLHETWIDGEPGSLIGSTAYGPRVYQDGTRWHMHCEKYKSHIVSSVLHIGKSADAEPWPLVLEDLLGNTHEVTMFPGDLLLLESAKLMHGRPKPLKGTWYANMYFHYYPKEADVLSLGLDLDGEFVTQSQRKPWNAWDRMVDPHYAVPELWREEATEHSMLLEEVEMKGNMGMTEPDCPPYDWCNLAEAYEWSGPGTEGEIVSTLNMEEEEEEEEEGEEDEEEEEEEEEF